MRRSYYSLMVWLLVCLMFAAFSMQARASSYIGIDGSSVTVENTVDDDVNPRGLRLRLGTRLDSFFDIEVHAGGAVDNSTLAFEELGVTYIGLYAKGYLPVGERSALFALVGGASVELTQSVGRGEFSDDRSGLSYGFGLETQLSHYLDLSADFMRYSLNDDEFSEVSAVNLGLKWYF